jgi:hypothetical protein
MVSYISETEFNNIDNKNSIKITGIVYNTTDFNKSTWHFNNNAESYDSQIRIMIDDDNSMKLSHLYDFNGNTNTDNFYFSLEGSDSSICLGKGRNVYGTYVYKISTYYNRIFTFNVEVKYYVLKSPKSVQKVSNFNAAELHTMRKRKSFDVGKYHNDLSNLVSQPRKTRSFSGRFQEREEADEIRDFLQSL